MHTNGQHKTLLNHASYLLSNVVIYNNVSNLVQQLCQRGDGGGCCCNVFHATTPHETVKLPVSYSWAAARCHQEARRWRRRLHSQQQPDRTGQLSCVYRKSDTVMLQASTYRSCARKTPMTLAMLMLMSTGKATSGP